MIPQLVTVGRRRRDGRWSRLYVPVVPVLLVLSPLLLLLVLGGLIPCRIFQVNYLGSLRFAGRLLWSLPGAFFEFEEGRTAMRISIR